MRVASYEFIVFFKDDVLRIQHNCLKLLYIFHIQFKFIGQWQWENEKSNFCRLPQKLQITLQIKENCFFLLKLLSWLIPVSQCYNDQLENLSKISEEFRLDKSSTNQVFSYLQFPVLSGWNWSERSSCAKKLS